MSEAARWLAFALLVAGASWVLHGPARLLERNAALIIRQRMSSTLINTLFDLPLSWHESHHSGTTAHRVHQSTQALSNFAQSQFIYLNSGVRLLGPLAALFWVQPLVGAAAVTGFALIVLSVAGFDRAMLRLANEENDAERLYSAALIDSLGNAGTVYALRQARLVAARVERRLLAAFIPLRKTIVLNEAKWCTVDLATRTLNCGLVGLFVWLATRASAGAGAGAGSSLGQPVLLGSLYMVWEYAQQAAGVIASIASHFQTFARQHADYASANLIRDAAASPTAPSPDAPRLAVPMQAAPMPAATNWRRIAVNDLTYQHAANRGNGPTLDRLSFTLERGKRYAVIGASGSGKSTLLRVLAGLYPAERIALTFDDAVTQIAPNAAALLLRAGATLIPQDAEVYEGSLAENLSLCESISGAPQTGAYSAALQAACATDFVEATAPGLNAMIEERAANWSGGQRSRVALARGILAADGSALVLMDEPTASLDPATEARVYTNLFDTFADACIVSSIHRLELLGRFDQVLVMRDGRLVAQGTPDELALTSAEYARLTTLAFREATVSAASVPRSIPAPQINSLH